MDFAIVVVLAKVDFDVFCSCGVHGDIIVAFESAELVGLAAGDVFDTNIINNKCELGETCVMFTQSGNNVALPIPGYIEVLFQEVVPYTAGLRQTINAMNSSYVYSSIMCGFFMEFIFLHDFFWAVAEYLFGKIRSICEVNAHELCMTLLRNISIRSNVAVLVPMSSG